MKPRSRILVYANRAHTAPDIRDAVSGHAQIPLAICRGLRSLGYPVQLVTSAPASSSDVLDCCDPVRLVWNATPAGRSGGLRIGGMLIHVTQLLFHIRRNRGGVVHFFGMKRVGLLLGLLSLWRSGVRTVYTPVHYGHVPENPILAQIERGLLRQVDCILPTSDYVASMLARVGLASGAVLRPGVVKDLSRSEEPVEQCAAEERTTVLFWRDATFQNGVDIAAEIYRCLAPLHPDVDFVFAVRFEDESCKDMVEVEARFQNVQVYRLPYPKGVSLQSLLRRAACVLLPMRTLSVQPQFAVLESMAAGVPVVTTSIESNVELIESGTTGFLFDPSDVQSATDTVSLLISNKPLRERVAAAARRSAREKFNYPRLLETLTEVYDGLSGRRQGSACPVRMAERRSGDSFRGLSSLGELTRLRHIARASPLSSSAP